MTTVYQSEPQPTFAILLIDNHPSDVSLITEHLRHVRTFQPHLNTVQDVTDALQYLQTTPVDAILLDLVLTDSQGVTTLTQIHSAVPQTPIIVMTDEPLEALYLAKAGAQDFIPKDRLDPDLLERVLRYAVERQHLLTQIEQKRTTDMHNREVQSLDRLSSPGNTITAQMFGLAPLRESAPNIFYELVLQYEALIDLAVEQRAYRVEHNLNERLRFMAERVGFLNAGPRDIIEVHATAIKRKLNGQSPPRSQIYLEEGRLIVLELMGHLVSFYRNYALGTRRPISRNRIIESDPPKT
jgi:DNA-binding NarL/FixJ family response regulator